MLAFEKLNFLLICGSSCEDPRRLFSYREGRSTLTTALWRVGYSGLSISRKATVSGTTHDHCYSDVMVNFHAGGIGGVVREIRLVITDH